MRCFLLKFTVVLNRVLLFWKLLAFEFLLGTSETLLCSVSAPQADIVLLLDVLQLLMLFAGILTYLEPNLFSLITFYESNYNYYFIIIIIIIIIIITIM
jgi:hypothetical protein